MLDYIDSVTAANSLDDVWDLHCRAMAGFGFDRLIYGYSKFVLEKSFGEFEDAIFLSNHGARYFDQFVRERMFLHAPIFRWARDHVGACSWGAVWADIDSLSEEERNVIAFNKKNRVTAGYSIRFADANPRSFGLMGLTARVGIDQAAVDDIWRRDGRQIEAMNNVVHLKIISLPHPSPSERLTLRQREVLGWVADGKSHQDIAQILGVSTVTVEKHLRLAREKLGVETTAQAVLKSAFHNQIFLNRSEH